MFITNKNLSRRTVLKGIGVTMALPLLGLLAPIVRSRLSEMATVALASEVSVAAAMVTS